MSISEVHLVDGTYELFRHFYAVPSRASVGPRPGTLEDMPIDIGAVRGVVDNVMRLLERGATHVGVATDHIIESYRNDLWATYKTGAGIDPALRLQFEPLEEALRDLGVAVWAMVEYEADDALGAAAMVAAADERVGRVLILSPDKDLAQCVVGDRIVQVDRRKDAVTDHDGVVAKFGVPPAAIPDYLALVGDSADGYPGIAGFGAKSAAAVLSRYGTIEAIPAAPGQWDVPGVRSAVKLATTLQANLGNALLFKTLATLQTEGPVVGAVDAWCWHGGTERLDAWAGYLDLANLSGRVERLAAKRPR